MQKYFDQSISIINHIIPKTMRITKYRYLSEQRNLLTTFKLIYKTSYYQNTYDAKKDVDEPTHPVGDHDNVQESCMKLQL